MKFFAPTSFFKVPQPLMANQRITFYCGKKKPIL